MAKPSKDSPQSNSVWLTIEDFEFLCFNLARELMTFDEPIPDYNTRDNALLESALGQPKHGIGENLFYPTLTEQASVLFYSLIKNHPFVNGNKRIAVMALFVFLSINRKWTKIPPGELYRLAVGVSISNIKIRKKVTKDMAGLLEEYMMDNPINSK